MVLEATTNKIYVFGKTNLELNRHSQSPDQFIVPIEKKVKLICAGGDKFFAILNETSKPCVDFCRLKIPMLTLDIIEDLTNRPQGVPSAKRFKTSNFSSLPIADIENSAELKMVKRAFSSVACINVSFLAEGHRQALTTKSFVDFKKVHSVAEMIKGLDNENLNQLIVSKLITVFNKFIEKKVFYESLRIFLITPFIVDFSNLNNTNIQKLVLAYANAFNKISADFSGEIYFICSTYILLNLEKYFIC